MTSFGEKKKSKYLKELIVRIVQLELSLNDERIVATTIATAATTAVHGQESRRVGTGLGVDTRVLNSSISFNGDDVKWRDWRIVFRSFAGLISTSLILFAVDLITSVISLQLDEVIVETQQSVHER